MLKVAKKYIIAFPGNKEEELLNLIKGNSNVEIEEVKSLDEIVDGEMQKMDYLISSVSFCISFLSSFAKKESFIYKVNNPRIIVKKSEIDRFHKAEALNVLVERIIKSEKELSVLAKDIKESEERVKEINQFEGLSFVPQETEYSVSFIFQAGKKEKEVINKFCFKEGIFIKNISEGLPKDFFIALLLKDKKEVFLQFLEENNAEVVNYNFPNPPLKEKEIALEEIETKKRKEKNIKAEMLNAAVSFNDFKIYHDVLCLKKRQLEVKKRMAAKGFLSYVIFWSIEEEEKKFEKEVLRISREIRIVEIGLEKDEKPPVLIENNDWMSPFQSVTDIFGLPSENEIDPTPYLSFFFIIFFGICITDAAYGIMLALFSLIPLILFKKRFGKSKLLKLLFYGGISTFIMGILFGSYFGVSPTVLRISFMERFKVIDPIKDTVLFMGVAFALGYLQICFSQIVKIIKSLKHKDNGGLIEGIAWVSLYFSLGTYLLSTKFQFLGSIGLIWIMISLVFLLWVESRSQKIFLKPLVGSIKILQGMISTTSDILSYSRLMALGLGTGVIALIVNQIAFLFGEMIPYVGWLVSALILIGGHIFNLGINALGGFIHSARLQFVEFFPKFLEGGGRRLKPLGPELKYIEID